MTGDTQEAGLNSRNNLTAASNVTSQQPGSVTSRDLRTSRMTRRVRAVTRPASPPPSATIQALIDMGFSRRAAEVALKALGGIGEITPSPESIVGWILEHQDQIMEMEPPVSAHPGGDDQDDGGSDSDIDS